MLCTAAALILGAAQATFAQSDPTTAEGWIAHFSENWDEDAWTRRFARFPDGYMREEDSGWKARMRALQGLVTLGADALPTLHDVLAHGDDAERILAAQTLGYIADAASREPLLRAATGDANAAVRLYAVDSLGMLGAAAEDIDWETLRENETNRDVLKHIGYAVERDGAAVDPAVRRTLVEWDAESMDTAVVGQPAPGFTLESAQGETVRLSDFRGEQAVVLVFIYGDT